MGCREYAERRGVPICPPRCCSPRLSTVTSPAGSRQLWIKDCRVDPSRAEAHVISDGFPLRPTKLLKTFCKRIKEALCYRIAPAEWHQHSDLPRTSNPFARAQWRSSAPGRPMHVRLLQRLPPPAWPLPRWRPWQETAPSRPGRAICAVRVRRCSARETG